MNREQIHELLFDGLRIEFGSELIKNVHLCVECLLNAKENV